MWRCNRMIVSIMPMTCQGYAATRVVRSRQRRTEEALNLQQVRRVDDPVRIHIDTKVRRRGGLAQLRFHRDNVRSIHRSVSVHIPNEDAHGKSPVGRPGAIVQIMQGNIDYLDVANAGKICGHSICARTVVATDVAGAKNANITEGYVVNERDDDLVFAGTIPAFDPRPTSEWKIDIERTRISMDLARYCLGCGNDRPSTVELRKLIRGTAQRATVDTRRLRHAIDDQAADAIWIAGEIEVDGRAGGNDQAREVIDVVVCHAAVERKRRARCHAYIIGHTNASPNAAKRAIMRGSQGAIVNTGSSPVGV